MLEVGINRVLALDEESAMRLQQLQDSQLQLDLEGVGITLFFSFDDGKVSVDLDSEYESDTVVSGSPVALFAMSLPEEAGNWGTPESRVTISGDANLARDLERLFSRLDPDWEATLSRLLGDVWGHQVAAGMRSGARQARQTASQASEMVTEFLKRADGPLVQVADIRSFADAVDETRDAVERLEAKIRLLREGDEAENDS